MKGMEDLIFKKKEGNEPETHNLSISNRLTYVYCNSRREELEVGRVGKGKK